MAVRDRCTSANPFFNERNLPDRARAVLGSLKIDTETGDDILKPGKIARGGVV
jgi:hypothetical protein